jgi:phosphohistidine phosphatase
VPVGQLLLVRHAKAVSEIEDPQRPLSAEGQSQAKQIAAVIGKVIPQVDVIYHGGKRRAEETADILATAIESLKGVRWRAGLNPNDPVEDLLKELNEEGHDRVIIVGHLPFLGHLASRLLTGSVGSRTVRFAPASAANLSRSGKRWKLIWMVNPTLAEPVIRS